MTPAFRAFLKRHDKTIVTKMLRWVSRESTAGHSRTGPGWPTSSNQGTLLYALYSLPELLLYPSRRFEEYIHLLYALRLHTPTGHTDRGDLTTAIDQIKKYKDYIDQVGCWYTWQTWNVLFSVVVFTSIFHPFRDKSLVLFSNFGHERHLFQAKWRETMFSENSMATVLPTHSVFRQGLMCPRLAWT